MDNETGLSNKILPEISSRWSPKTFSDQEVEIFKLQKAFEAARWAPSSYNEQPWRFILGMKNYGKSYDLLFDAILEKNKYWAQSAPVLVLICCRECFSHKDQVNRCAVYDTGTAVGQMVIQLYNDNLHARQIAGLNLETARNNFNIPAEYHVICIVAIGYLAPDDGQMNAALPPRVRKNFDEFIFSENWDLKSGIF